MAIRTNAKLTGKRCQCPECGEVFSTESNFNKHRKGSYGIDRHCVDPESVGLVVGQVGDNTVWRGPSRDIGKAQ